MQGAAREEVHGQRAPRDDHGGIARRVTSGKGRRIWTATTQIRMAIAPLAPLVAAGRELVFQSRFLRSRVSEFGLSARRYHMGNCTICRARVIQQKIRIQWFPLGAKARKTRNCHLLAKRTIGEVWIHAGSREAEKDAKCYEQVENEHEHLNLFYLKISP